MTVLKKLRQLIFCEFSLIILNTFLHPLCFNSLFRSLLLFILLHYLIARLLLVVLLSVAGVDEVLAFSFLLLLGSFVNLLVLTLHQDSLLLLLLGNCHLIGFILSRRSAVSVWVKAREIVVQEDALTRLNFTASTATNWRLFVFSWKLLSLLTSAATRTKWCEWSWNLAVNSLCCLQYFWSTVRVLLIIAIEHRTLRGSLVWSRSLTSLRVRLSSLHIGLLLLKKTL